MATTVDERGRVLIPKDLREATGVIPGRSVRVFEEDGEIRIRPQLSPEEAIKSLFGAINEETRDPDADPIDPLDLKRIWEPRL